LTAPRPKRVWIVVGLAVFLGGWLVFDGAHGFVTGDYVTPDSGEFAGRLGPWSKLVEALGLEPRSGLVMGLHVAVGALALVASAAYARRRSGAWSLMLASAIGTLWYLPFGTLLGAAQIALLCTRAAREDACRSAD
jgi:hypothetical protein